MHWNCKYRQKTSIPFSWTRTHRMTRIEARAWTYAWKMNRELVECRRNAGREASTVIYVELPHCVISFHSLAFRGVETLDFSSIKPRLHASASNFIHHNYAARCPLSPGYLHRDLALFHSLKSTCTDYILAKNVYRLIAPLIRATYDFALSRKVNGFDLLRAFNLQSIISHNDAIIKLKRQIYRLIIN